MTHPTDNTPTGDAVPRSAAQGIIPELRDFVLNMPNLGDYPAGVPQELLVANEQAAIRAYHQRPTHAARCALYAATYVRRLAEKRQEQQLPGRHSVPPGGAPTPQVTTNPEPEPNPEPQPQEHTEQVL
jgi:hypothetical protein